MKQLKLQSGGLANFQGAVTALKDFGRYEDDTLAHVATGETIIPMEVFEKNPQLKEQVFKSMADLGIDPSQYIVGNNLNSINPVTGQPEFFLKKLFKRLKKAAADSSGYAAPIVGAMYGPAAGAATGALLGQYKRENPGDPTQGLNMALRGGIAGIGTNIATCRGAFNPLGGMRGAPGDKTNYMDKLLELFRKGGTSNPNLNKANSVGKSNKYRSFSKDNRGEIGFLDKLKNAFREKGEAGAKFDPKRIYGSLAAAGIFADMLSNQKEEEMYDFETYPGDYGQLANLGRAGMISGGSNIVPFKLKKGGIVELKKGGFPYATAKRAKGGVSGPGTGTSDDIPAYLSNGEFVVTAKAVKNAGGSQPMYDMMNHLEKGGSLSTESRGK